MDKQTAQQQAREILETGHGMTEVGQIVLSDDDQTVVADRQTVTTPTRLEDAAEQTRLIIGDSYDVDAIVGALERV